MIKFKPLTIDQVPYLVKWFNNSNVNKYLGIHSKATIKSQVAKIEREDKDFKSFVIFDDDKPIGIISLTKIDRADKNAGLFIVIGEDDYRGKGIGKQALKFITDYGFNELKLHKIYLEVHVQNEIAIRCYESFGFIKEGVLKDHSFKDGKYSDELMMAYYNR